MSQLSHAQFPLRRHPNLLVDHRRSRSAAVAEPRGANGEAVTGSGGRLHFGMVAGIKSERWPTSNRNPRPDCLGIRRGGVSSALAGDIAKARPYLDRAVELSESRELRAQALRFGQDARATALSYSAAPVGTRLSRVGCR